MSWRTSKRFIFAAGLFVAALALQASEIPLMPPSVGPSPKYKSIIGAVPSLNADGFFVVWSEGAYIIGTNVTNDGAVRERRGILLYEVPRGESYRLDGLRVDDGRYVLRIIQWHSSATGPTEYKILSLHFDAEGTQLGSSSIRKTNDYPAMWMPENAAGESLYLSRSQTETTVWTVGSDGVPRNPAGFGTLVSPSNITSSGDDWFFLELSGTHTVWYRFRPSALPGLQRQEYTLEQSIYDPSPVAFRQTVGTADGEFGVLQERLTSKSNQLERSLFFRVIRADGGSTKYTLIDKEALHQSTSSVPYGTASVAKDGDTWVVAFSWSAPGSQDELRTWRIGSTTVESTVFTTSDPRYPGYLRPWLTVGPSRTLLLFSHDPDLFAHVADRGTSILPTQPNALLAQSHPLEAAPHAAAGPEGTLAVWRLITGSSDLMMRFFDNFGHATDPVRISTAPLGSDGPVVTRNGPTFLVVWQEGLSTFKYVMQRFDAHGAAIDAAPIVVETSRGIMSNVSATPEADGFRLSWAGTDPAIHSYNAHPMVYTKHVEARGTAIPEADVLTEYWVSTRPPSTASAGAESIVLWTEDATVSSAGIHGQRYTGGVKAKGDVYYGIGAVSSAAMHDNELLIVSTHPSTSNQYQSCATVQRFALTGAALSPPVDLDGCGSGVLTSASLWNNGCWWVWWPQTPTLLHEIRADGTLGEVVQYFRPEVFPMTPQFFATTNDPAAVYVRDDAGTEMVGQTFLRTFPRPKARAARP